MNNEIEIEGMGKIKFEKLKGLPQIVCDSPFLIYLK